jgi:hypothetical protein
MSQTFRRGTAPCPAKAFRGGIQGTAQIAVKLEEFAARVREDLDHGEEAMKRTIVESLDSPRGYPR